MSLLSNLPCEAYLLAVTLNCFTFSIMRDLSICITTNLSLMSS